jgi:hypothetical protein
MSDEADDRDKHLIEREQALANARAALREEREHVTSSRAEADRLLAEALATVRAANRERNRAKRLAQRFVRRVQNQQDEVRRQLDAETNRLKTERARLDLDVKQFQTARSEFYAHALAARDRLRDAWAAVRTQQKRTAREWIEANRHFTEENAILTNQAAELARREKQLADMKAKVEAETAGFREEATGLEARIENARTSLAELEARRDRTRAELLGRAWPGELSELATSGDKKNDRDRVPATQLLLTDESSDPRDRERLVAEQFTMLAQARTLWQQAERQTVIEMEDLARELGQHERELQIREQRLSRSEIRRRGDAYDLWQFRLRLEAWQTKLTAFEMQWHTEREQQEADFERRLSQVARREVDIEELGRAWEKARSREREQLRAELELWADDRKRFTAALGDFERQKDILNQELSQHAARALASEELLSQLVPDLGTGRQSRRLAVLRKWWQRKFERQAREIAARRLELSEERVAIDERYQALQARLLEVVEREVALNKRETETRKTTRAIADERDPGERSGSKTPSPTVELSALRNEIERLATMLLEVELPEPPSPPQSELPWAFEEATTSSTDVRSYDQGAWAA